MLMGAMVHWMVKSDDVGRRDWYEVIGTVSHERRKAGILVRPVYAKC